MKIIIMVLTFGLVYLQASQELKSQYSYVEPIAIENAPVAEIKEVPAVPEEVAVVEEEPIEIELPSKELELPEEEEIVKVVQEVIIPDEDGDGVEDLKDNCPNTPSGFQVTEDGCPKKATLKVSFAPDRYNIAPNMVKKLEEFASFLKENTNYQVIIYGYTDSIGNDKNNKLLSQKRADSVKEALVGLGVKSTKLTAIGKGEENPVASNMYKSGRKQNRRIEAELIY